MINDILALLNKTNHQISSVDKLYFYQIDGRNVQLNKMMSVKDENVIPFNPFIIIKTE